MLWLYVAEKGNEFLLIQKRFYMGFLKRNIIWKMRRKYVDVFTEGKFY